MKVGALTRSLWAILLPGALGGHHDGRANVSVALDDLVQSSPSAPRPGELSPRRRILPFVGTSDMDVCAQNLPMPVDEDTLLQSQKNETIQGSRPNILLILSDQQLHFTPLEAFMF